MKKIQLLSLLLLALATMAFILPPKTVYEYDAKDIFGNRVPLSKYKGKVLLIVNVASKCSNTPQYADLQALYDKYNEYGLEVLGFPANNFLGQEPGSNEQINRFCTQKFGVTFPMFSKISVKGRKMHPLYKYLTKRKVNGTMNAPVKWNFQKFLVDADGQVSKRFLPRERITKDKIEKQIRRALLKSLDNKDKKKELKSLELTAQSKL